MNTDHADARSLEARSELAPANDPARRGPSPRAARNVRIASILVVAASLVLALRAIPIDRVALELERRTEALGPASALVLAGVYVVAALLLLPSAPFTFAAGALLGTRVAIAVMAPASACAAAIAFLASRRFARGRVERAVRSRRHFAAIDRAVSEGGWRIVLLLRMAPLVPFSWGNYLFGLTGARFVPYVVGSFLGMLPSTITYAMLGGLGAEGIEGLGAGRESTEEVLLLVRVAATIAVSWILARVARRHLRELAANAAEPQRASESVAARERRAWWPTIAWTALALASIAFLAVASTCSDELLDALARRA